MVPGKHARLGAALIDAYSGVGGIAVALASYQYAVGRGLADPVSTVEKALQGAVLTLRHGGTDQLQRGLGGFDGHASELWAWLALHNLTGDTSHLRYACASADRIAYGIKDQTENDIVSGAAGALVPLLCLASVTGETRHTDTATEIAEHIAGMARINGEHASWPTSTQTGVFVGFAHGATGIGWALTRLGLTTGIPRWVDLGAMALAHDTAVFDWAAASSSPDLPTTWCNGSTGIGLAHHDLSTRTGLPHHGRLVTDAFRHMRHTPLAGHTLCHGSAGARELLMVCDPAAADQALRQLLADVEHMTASDALVSAGLLNGLSGTLLHLLRAHSHLRTLPNRSCSTPARWMSLRFRQPTQH